MSKCFKVFDIPVFRTDNFTLCPAELKDYIDFDVRRMYFITETKGGTGSHCHHIEKEMFVVARGSCDAVIDKGNGLERIQLTGPSQCIYVGPYIWHHFENFSDDALVIALSSTNYSPDRSDYIEDYNEYLKIRDEKLAI